VMRFDQSEIANAIASLAITATRRRSVASSRPSLRSRARFAWLSHACWTVACVLIGMSESYHWLGWAKVLIPALNLLLVPAAIAFPVVVCVLSRRDGTSSERTTVAVLLSVVLSIASFFAIIPLIC
jgi:hypothetical protein